MVDFSAFDQKVDMTALQKEVQNADDSGFSPVPDGTYIVSVHKMEVGLTKAKDKVMFSVQMKIKDGDQKGRLLFFNRTISGSKSQKWTDAMAIKSVCTWVNKLLADGDQPVEFVNYNVLASDVLDVFQAVQNAIEVEVSYEEKNFNPITINEVFEL